MKKRSKPTWAELEKRVKILEAYLTTHLFGAYRDLDNLGCDKYMASGLIVTITNLDGISVCKRFVCVDGLEQDTINCLKKQIKKTLDLQESQRPKELR